MPQVDATLGKHLRFARKLQRAMWARDLVVVVGIVDPHPPDFGLNTVLALAMTGL